MNKIEKKALESLSQLYFYGEERIESITKRVDYGIKYTELRDALKEAINNKK